ncbi:MAG: hypothetical protein K0R69_2300 [Clostridia bacterium]|jgi:stage V sporulation protein D (sporulation-specific penicillin-binding protein)|nr:hypothetical protein [Clostridia bacterium]
MKKTYKTKIAFIGCLFMSAMICMAFRITMIKIENGQEYQKQVLSRLLSQERQIYPKRGTIVERNNKVIAVSTLSYHVILSPKDILGLKIVDRDKVYQTLSRYLGQSQGSIKQTVEASPSSQYSVMPWDLESKKAKQLKEEGLRGVWLEESFSRKYPKEALAAQLIGFYNKNGQGQYGIEQQYNDVMLGKQGRIFSQIQDEAIITSEIKSAENGATIVLTIDEVIQQYVTGIMKKYIKVYKPINASAIIMNPNTGEIYSMFSYPYFDPNHYNDLRNELGKDVWDVLKEDEKARQLNHAWRNYNIQASYEPGSTFKPLLVAASLDEEVINRKEMYVCDGSVMVAKETAPIRCWKREGHGKQTLEEVLANSCNEGMIEIGSKMSSDIFLKYINRYGFGKISNIGLPGEEKGLLHQKLGVVERATYSIGQGFTCTPIQLITAFSAVINGGQLLQPYVVSEIISENNEMIYQSKPVVKRQVISQETSHIVTDYLRKVVDGGTGVNASITGYNIGGKTGTAEKLPRGNEKYILSFVGYAPTTNPQVIGLIVFDEIPEHSGVPAHVFKEVMLNILPYMNIALNLDKAAQSEQTYSVPDVTTMDIYKASEKLDAQNLKYEIVGVGQEVIKQYPNEGAQILKGSKVKLYVHTEKPGDLMEIPDLQGLTLEEAMLLTGITFNVRGEGKGKIITQVPQAGHKIEKHSQILVKLAE